MSEFYSLGTGDGEREHLRLMTSFANFQEAKVVESGFPVSHLVVSGGPAANQQLSIPKAHVLSTYT